MERRQFTRVEFKAMASIKSPKVETTGNVQNLSLNGMFFVTEETFQTGDPIDIKIYISGSTSDIFVSLQGIVLRQEEEGVAVQFKMDSIDMDALTVLRYVLAYNGMDDQQVLKEYSEFQNRRETIQPSKQ